MNGGDDKSKASPASASPSTQGTGGSNASPLMQQVALAMDLTDVIRKHDAPTTEEQKDKGFFRNFLMTPGVQQGVFTLFLCTAIAVPTRRFVISVSKRQLNLGTIFPDLMISPALAVLTAQSALFAGSCYGSAEYLDRLAKTAPTAPSKIADSVCNDPKFTNASLINSNHDLSLLLQLDEQKNNSWDPRTSAVESLRRALQSCQKRRAFQQQQQDYSSASFDQDGDAQETTRISWWK